MIINIRLSIRISLSLSVQLSAFSATAPSLIADG
jgi:hypothetical protein